MSLFSTIQQSSGALQAAQVGLQVVGNNIANANTEGYIRERLEQAPAAAVRHGRLIKGQGVRPTGIKQIVDKALAERMYNASTALGSAETIEKAYTQLEELTADLENNGLNQQLSLLNNAFHELSTQPADPTAREFVILQADSLATNLNRAREAALERQQAWNNRVAGIADDVNRLSHQIAELNVEIATTEGGGAVGSDATGLRDQRYQALEELSELIDINIQELDNGNVSVFVGGDYLVNNGLRREVHAVYDEEAGGQQVRIVETDSPLQVTGGTLAGTIQARNEVFGNYVDQLDEVAGALIRSVNEVHSQGQGRTGYQSLEASVATEPGVPLPEAGLPWTPKNGAFDINVVDLDGEVISSHRIDVRMLGQVGDSTVGSVVADIDAIDGLTARVDGNGRIEIESDTPTAQFTFGEDTSGFLAATGVNTLFDGSDASDIAVRSELQENSDLLAVSRGGINADTETLTRMLDLVDKPLDFKSGQSVRGIYEQTIAATGQKVSLHKSATEGLRNFHATLESRHLAITGVNIDEESIKLISYQRAFQASSRVIATASEMLEILVSL